MDKILKTEEEWHKSLTPEQYEVLRNKGTERAFTGEYDRTFDDGKYLCAACGLELFKSDNKYDAGCGWPSFTKPIAADHIETAVDTAFGMRRTEVMCPRCGGHLGHVFDDGPKEEGGARYCINSLALKFKK